MNTARELQRNKALRDACQNPRDFMERERTLSGKGLTENQQLQVVVTKQSARPDRA